MSNEEHPSYQLWKLRQYLARYKPDGQTIMVNLDGKLTEFAFTSDYSLGDQFKRLGFNESFSLAMSEIGLDPFQRSHVYAYVLRRSPEFCDKWYGWGKER
jgi:hypothetical protein